MRMATTCHIRGCGQAIARDLLLCGGHWRHVPTRHRRRMAGAVRLWRLGRGSLEAVTAARQAAVAALEMLLSRKVLA
jgi:hypothetical protein